MTMQRMFGLVSVGFATALVALGGCSDSDTDSGSTSSSSSSASSTATSSTTGAGGESSSSTTGGGGDGGMASTSTTTSTTGAGGMGAGGDMGTGGSGGVVDPAFLDITFDDAAITYTLTGFGGAEDSTVIVDPTNAANMVVQVVKAADAQLWAGTTVSTLANDSIPALPLATSTIMTAKVWSPDAGIQVRLKIEDANDPTHSVETEATTTMAGAWETLTFDFSNEATGTAALNTAYTFDRVSIFFNFGVDGAAAGGAKTYYLDNLMFP